MSQLATELPDVIVKPGKMLGKWGPRMKTAAFVLLVALYGYLLLLIKTIYIKDQRLDHISAVAMDTEKMIDNLRALDQNLASDIEVLDSFHTDH